MVYVYQILSGSVGLVSTFGCMSDFFASEYYGREDIIYEVKDVW